MVHIVLDCIGTSTTYTHIKTARLIDPLFGLWQTVDSEQSQWRFWNILKRSQYCPMFFSKFPRQGRAVLVSTRVNFRRWPKWIASTTSPCLTRLRERESPTTSPAPESKGGLAQCCGGQPGQPLPLRPLRWAPAKASPSSPPVGSPGGPLLRNWNLSPATRGECTPTISPDAPRGWPWSSTLRNDLATDLCTWRNCWTASWLRTSTLPSKNCAPQHAWHKDKTRIPTFHSTKQWNKQTF